MKPRARLVEATPFDADQLETFLAAMATETNELTYDSLITRAAVARSFGENVHWFLFHDENERPFGVCHCQSVHNYWRLEKRFYLSGFYIDPAYRGRGFFRSLNDELRRWVSAQGGVQLYAHIHADNERSRDAFAKAGFEEIDYRLYVSHWGA